MKYTLKELISAGNELLRHAGVENAGYDAEALLRFETGHDRQQVFLNRDFPVDEALARRYYALVFRRSAGEPLQYITGEQYFMGHRFAVDPSVLIPRPETEILAEKAIDYVKTYTGAENGIPVVLDLCTGSGALAISIAKACPRTRVIASDISEDALDTARRNAFDLGADCNTEFILSDLFESIDMEFDLIVTNPPYVRTGELPGLQREIREHEPLSALDGGEDGLKYYRLIAAGTKDHLRKGGCLIAEIGMDQARSVSDIFRAAGFAQIEVFQDFAGRSRIIKII